MAIKLSDHVIYFFEKGYPSLPVYSTKGFKDTMFMLTVTDLGHMHLSSIGT